MHPYVSGLLAGSRAQKLEQAAAAGEPRTRAAAHARTAVGGT